MKEGHLRWDSLGEYCALVPSLELAAEKTGNDKVAILAETLDAAIAAYLENGRLPSRKVNEIDNRGQLLLSRAVLGARRSPAQTRDADMQARFAPVAKALAANETKIVEELLAAQGEPQDVGGYYLPDDAMAKKAMRPSPTFNAIIDGME